MTTEERLLHLEQELKRANRRFHLLLAGLAAVGLAVLIGGASPEPASDLFVKSLTVVDDKGNTKLSMGTKDGEGIAAWYDRTGKSCILIGTDKQGQAYSGWYDLNGQVRVTIGTDTKIAGIDVYDVNGNGRIDIGTNDKLAMIRVRDSDGKSGVASVTTSQGSSTQWFDQNRKTRVEIGTRAGEAGATLNDPDGRSRIGLTTYENQRAEISLYDLSDKKRYFSSTDPNGVAMSVWSDPDKPRLSATVDDKGNAYFEQNSQILGSK